MDSSLIRTMLEAEDNVTLSSGFLHLWCKRSIVSTFPLFFFRTGEISALGHLRLIHQLTATEFPKKKITRVTATYTSYAIPLV